ncbi:MAG: hypothetical protein KAG20_04135 [Cocleimonas sp.]|nr:hypothetical protein [Cocleimonas sp.]
MIFKVLGIFFVISIFIPVEFHYLVGSLRIEAYRVVLGVALLYSFLNIKELLGRVDLIDILLFLFILLAAASLIYNHGIQKGIESSGILAIEVLGAFYLARGLITTPKRYYRFNMLFVSILAVLVLVSVYEALAQHRILHEWAKNITGHDSLNWKLYTHYYVRFGIMRTTNLFAHPILYGTIGAIFFPFIILLVLYRFKVSNLLRAFALLIGMISTLSSAPLLSVAFQGMTAVLAQYWTGAKRLWVAVAFFAISAFLIIEAMSNRGFFAILISYLTFNPVTGYYRMLQWEYSMDDIAANPVFGIGLHDWSRPEWMNSSIDSFWLLMTMQHGVFAGFILLFCSLYAVFHILNDLHKHHPATRWMVKSWILAFMSLILIGFTVDYFGKIQPLFFFVLGSIGWAKYYPALNKSVEKSIHKVQQRARRKQQRRL